MKVSGNIIQIDEKGGNPLRAKARLIKDEEFDSPYLQKVLRTMHQALAKETDGVALAAPQIGLSLSIFVVSPNAYSDETKSKPLVFINPKIVKKSKKTAEMQEGCLSVRWVYGKTRRALNVTVEAYDATGKKFSYGASGLIAHIFQHEIDHLSGILFTDHGFDFEEYTEEEVMATQKNKK